MGGDVRAHEMRTFDALRAPAPAPDAVARLSDRALRIAAANPDHSEAARAAIAEALRARRIAPEPWRVAVESFIRARDLERGQALFFGWSRTARLWLASLARLGALAVVALIGYRAFAANGAAVATPQIAAAAAATLLFAAAWAVAVAFRRHPARVLVLGGRDIALQRMIERELRPFGHIARPDAPDGPYVRNAADYRALARRMGKRIRLNFATALSTREALPVRASEAWRPLVRQLLADSSDVLIVDLSESVDLAALEQRERCVFVTLWGGIDAAEAALRQAGIDAPCFFYAPDGEMQRRGQFRAAMLAAIRARA